MTELEDFFRKGALVILGGFILMMAYVVGMNVWYYATKHDNDGIPCESVGVYTSASGTPVILRECPDGTFVTDYPYLGE